MLTVALLVLKAAIMTAKAAVFIWHWQVLSLRLLLYRINITSPRTSLVVPS